MTRRKPPGVRWESWVEKQIREAHESGAFEALPGAGRPLPSRGEPYDETWWVRDKARREQVSLLPATLVVRKKAEHLAEHLHELRTEADVRAAVAALNAEIAEADRTAMGGPPSRLLPRDADALAALWREERQRQEEEARREQQAAAPPSPAPRRGLAGLLRRRVR